MKRIITVASLLTIAAIVVGGFGLKWSQVAPQAAEASSVKTAAQASVAQAQAAKVQKESAQIQAMLSNFQQQYPGQVSIEAVDLDDGAYGSADADDQMVSASLYKIFVAWGIYQKIDAGTLTVNSDVSAVNETVGQCLNAMITVSDNDCGKALGDIDGWGALDNNLKALGLTQTTLNNYDSSGNVQGDKMTTVHDVTIFMEKLYQGKLLSSGSTAAFINLLKNDALNDWLPSGLPSGTVIAHKTGALYNLVHDAGIIYTSKGNYLVVMMTQGWQDPTTQPPPVFAQISKQLWNYFTS